MGKSSGMSWLANFSSISSGKGRKTLDSPTTKIPVSRVEGTRSNTASQTWGRTGRIARASRQSSRCIRIMSSEPRKKMPNMLKAHCPSSRVSASTFAGAMTIRANMPANQRSTRRGNSAAPP